MARRLSDSEKRVLLASVGKRSSSTHNLNMRVLHWRYCSRCGLLALNNKATRKALKAPCVIYE